MFSIRPPHSSLLPKAKQFAVLFHDIFGNPFRPVTLDPSWRTDSRRRLATAIYD